MKHGMGRMLAMGLLAGGLLVVGCTELSQEPGPYHTPIQNKYQDGAAGAATEMDSSREGLNMPDWQNHPTMEQDEEEEMGPTGANSRLEPGTPTVPTPEEAYQTAEDVMAPRAGEGTPEVETMPAQPDDEQAIGGGGDVDEQDDIQIRR